jgi:hypothetical protein
VFPLARLLCCACALAACAGSIEAPSTDAAADAASGRSDAAAPDASDESDAAGLDAEAAGPDATPASVDGGHEAGDTGSDGGTAITCAWGGAPGLCLTLAECAALPDHTSFAGKCPGPASIECCIVTPSTADNPPAPPGYKLMQQADVTPEMTTWAVAILNDPATYPMFATTTRTFGALTVLARVEWHPPDFQNSVVHRGVTLYEPK